MFRDHIGVLGEYVDAHMLSVREGSPRPFDHRIEVELSTVYLDAAAAWAELTLLAPRDRGAHLRPPRRCRRGRVGSATPSERSQLRVVVAKSPKRPATR
jgi:hypothetical protein